MRGRSDSRGIALIITLLAISLFSALALGLVLASSANRLAANNHRDGVALLNSAEAALSLASRDLATIDDWTTVIDGSVRGTFVDGLPGMRTRPGGVAIDIPVLTNELTCARPTACSDARVQTSSSERPWGVNNPRWQPFIYGPLDSAGGHDMFATAYVIVWIGDDAQ